MRVAEVLLRVLGAVLLAWAVCIPLLGLFGAETDATVTHVRRQVGERGEVFRNRYIFVVSYHFTLPDRGVVQGSAQMIGDFGDIPTLRAAQPFRVRYVTFWPALNVPSIQTRPNFKHLVLAVVGWMLLIGLWRGKRGRRNASRQKARPKVPP